MTQRKKEWFDNEEFWRELYPFMFGEQRIAAATEEVKGALALAKPKGRRALDLCCGPGRCAIALAKRGFTVTGVDRTRFLLRKARASARALEVTIEWVQQDMRDFVRPNSFDLVLSMFTSFGYFDDKREDIAVLGNIFASLQPGGVLLMEMMGKERLAKVYLPATYSELPDGTQLVQRHEVLDDWTRISNEWILIRGGRTTSFRFHHTIYSGQELRDRLEGVGFVDVQLYGDFAGSDYGLNAQRLIAVARKPRQTKS